MENSGNNLLGEKESLRNFSRSLPMVLLRAREMVMERFRPNLRAHNLTDQQWRILRALFDQGKKDLGELSNMCCILKPSITRIIRSMEERSLLKRSADNYDQRRTIVSITTIGRDLISVVGPNSEAIYQDIASALGANELEDLYSKLDTLMSRLTENSK